MNTCPFCGRPMRANYALATKANGRCVRIPLPAGPHCGDPECRAEHRAEQDKRDDAAIARAIKMGVIDP